MAQGISQSAASHQQAVKAPADSRYIFKQNQTKKEPHLPTVKWFNKSHLQKKRGETFELEISSAFTASSLEKILISLKSVIVFDFSGVRDSSLLQSSKGLFHWMESASAWNSTKYNSAARLHFTLYALVGQIIFHLSGCRCHICNSVQPIQVLNIH